MTDKAQTIEVDATALRAVLVALTGPGHLIRELQVMNSPSLSALSPDELNPIGTLLKQFNAWVAAASGAAQGDDHG